MSQTFPKFYVSILANYKVHEIATGLKSVYRTIFTSQEYRNAEDQASSIKAARAREESDIERQKELAAQEKVIRSAGIKAATMALPVRAPAHASAEAQNKMPAAVAPVNDQISEEEVKVAAAPHPPAPGTGIGTNQAPDHGTNQAAGIDAALEHAADSHDTLKEVETAVMAGLTAGLSEARAQVLNNALAEAPAQALNLPRHGPAHISLQGVLHPCKHVSVIVTPPATFRSVPKVAGLVEFEVKEALNNLIGVHLPKVLSQLLFDGDLTVGLRLLIDEEPTMHLRWRTPDLFQLLGQKGNLADSNARETPPQHVPLKDQENKGGMKPADATQKVTSGEAADATQKVTSGEAADATQKVTSGEATEAAETASFIQTEKLLSIMEAQGYLIMLRVKAYKNNNFVYVAIQLLICKAVLCRIIININNSIEIKNASKTPLNFIEKRVSYLITLRKILDSFAGMSVTYFCFVNVGKASDFIYPRFFCILQIIGEGCKTLSAANCFIIPKQILTYSLNFLKSIGLIPVLTYINVIQIEELYLLTSSSVNLFVGSKARTLVLNVLDMAVESSSYVIRRTGPLLFNFRKAESKNKVISDVKSVNERHLD